MSTRQLLEKEVQGMRFIAMRTSAKDVVRIEGSLLGGQNMLPKAKSMAAVFTALLLDAGTARRSKDAIRDGLAARGASLSFSSGGDRLLFSASCLPEDVSYVFSVILECLKEATFPAKELALAKERTCAELEESKSDTRTVASAAFSRLVFDATHPNYAEKTETRMKEVRAVTRAELLSFRKQLGHQGLILTIVGDVVPEKSVRQAVATFKKLSAVGFTTPNKMANTKKATPDAQLVTIKDKANIDVYMGSAVPLTYEHKEYLPFVVLLSLLGGRGLSTGHLMRTIRERDGLTYGIYASLTGLDDGTDGAWNIWGTFAPSVFSKGVDAVKREVIAFLKKPVTEQSLELKKSEIVGNYLVGLTTTRGLAIILHRIAREGKPLSYVDDYPKLIQALTVSSVASTAKYISVSSLTLAASGTFSA